MNVKQKSNYGFYFVITFMIGCVSIVSLYAQQTDDQRTIEWIIEQKIAAVGLEQEIQTWTNNKLSNNWITKNPKNNIRVEVQRSTKPQVKVWESLGRYFEHNVNCDTIVMHNDFATEVAKFYCSLLPNDIMLAAYNQESWYNPRAKWWLWEMWVCQLLQNTTNSVWLDDDRRWSDRKRQAERCVNKWKAVPNPAKIWASVSGWEYRKYLYLFQK